jgi:hypothetical protein
MDRRRRDLVDAIVNGAVWRWKENSMKRKRRTVARQSI